MPINIEWQDWSEWTKLAELNLESVPNAPGAYVIATRSDIRRVVGTDPDGILDVGETKYLNDRISSFISCAIDPNTYGHMAGVRFTLLGFGEIFPYNTLWIRYIKLKTKELAYSVEGEILKQYVGEHKELPPLNYKYNWSKHE